MRVVGLDVSRTVAEIAYLEDGRISAGGRVEVQHSRLRAFAGHNLRPTDEVVHEATGNTAAIVAALKPFVARVVVANPLQVRLIAEAKVKTDKIDAAILAQLHASGFLPGGVDPRRGNAGPAASSGAPRADRPSTHPAQKRNSRRTGHPSNHEVPGERSVR